MNQEIVDIAKYSLSVATATGGLIFALWKAHVIEFKGRNGHDKVDASVPPSCPVPACHDNVIITATKTIELEKGQERLEKGQGRLFELIDELPDKIVNRISVRR